MISSKRIVVAALLLAVAALSVAQAAKQEKDVTQLQIGVKVSCRQAGVHCGGRRSGWRMQPLLSLLGALPLLDQPSHRLPITPSLTTVQARGLRHCSQG